MREQALACLARFEQRYLAAALRRLTQWKGFDARRHEDVLDDVRQELAVDCLVGAEEVLALEERERHRRWFRIVQQVHYRLRTRDARYETGNAELDRLPTQSVDDDLDALEMRGDHRDALKSIQRAATHLKNGRLNAEATASALGMHRVQFKQLWERLTNALGFGDHYVDFWRERLLEALVQHTADRLTANGALRVCRQSTRLPDPRASRRRIERVRAALSSHPPTQQLKSVFAQALGKHTTPRDLIEAATALSPEHAGVDLWRFEVAVAERDLGDASRALGLAREHGAARVPLVLARARLFEARGEEHYAVDLLRDAEAARPDARLRASLDSLLRHLED